MRKKYALLAALIVAGFFLLQFTLPLFSPTIPIDPEPSHYVQLWGAEANFTYIFDMGWYLNEQDAMMGENQQSGWGTRITPDGDTNRTAHFYRIPESSSSIWIRIELYKSENGDEAFMDSTHTRIDIGMKKTIVVGGLVFNLLITRA